MELDQKALGAAVAKFEDEFDGTYTADDLIVKVLQAYLASLPSDDEVGRLIKRADRRCENGKVFHAERTLIKELSVALQSQAVALAAVRAERANLQAALTARAKTMLRLRDALVQVHDHIEDEGDRVYFGSTNDAETLKDVWHELDGWNWDDITSDGKLPDVYEASRKAHTRAERAEAVLADIAEMTDADDPESYRCDDREGCLDAVHAAARRAHSKDGGERNG